MEPISASGEGLADPQLQDSTHPRAALVLHAPGTRTCEEGCRRADVQAPVGENVAGALPVTPDGRWIVSPPELDQWALGGSGNVQGIPWPAWLGVLFVVTSLIPPPHPPAAVKPGKGSSLPAGSTPCYCKPGINLITHLSPRGGGMEAPRGIVSCPRLLGRIVHPGSRALPGVPCPPALAPATNPDLRVHLALSLPHGRAPALTPR